MKHAVGFLVAIPFLICAGSTPAALEDPSPARLAADKERAALELNILKKELEELRIARVQHLRDIEFKRIYMDSLKQKSLRQRELQEELDVLKEQLTALDRMIAEADRRLDEAFLRQQPDAAPPRP